jgi:hypothetical protein
MIAGHRHHNRLHAPALSEQKERQQKSGGGLGANAGDARQGDGQGRGLLHHYGLAVGCNANLLCRRLKLLRGAFNAAESGAKARDLVFDLAQ